MRLSASYVAIAFGLGSPLLASGSPIPASSVNTSPANSPNPNAGEGAFSGLAPESLTNKKSSLNQDSLKEMAASPANYNAGVARGLEGLGLLGGDGAVPPVLDGGLDLTGKEENTAEAKLNLCSILGINCPPVKASSSTKTVPKKPVGSVKPPKNVSVSTKGSPKVSTKPKSGSGEKKSGSGGKHQVNDHHNANGGSSKGGNGGSANGGSADCSTGASLVGFSALNFNSCNGGAGGNASGGASVGGKGGDTLNSLSERDVATAQDLEHTSNTSPILSRAEAIADAKKKKKTTPKKNKNILQSLGLGSKSLGPIFGRDDAPPAEGGAPKESEEPKSYTPEEPSSPSKAPKMPKGMKKPKTSKFPKGDYKNLPRDTGVDAYGTKAETNDLEMEKRILTNMNDYENVIKSRADPEGGKGGNSQTGNGGTANGGDSYSSGGSLFSVNAFNFDSNNGGNAGHAESGSAQGGHGGETVHNHNHESPSHKKAASTEKKLQHAFERDGLTATAEHSPNQDAYGLNARQEPPSSTTPPSAEGKDDGSNKDMNFSAHHDQSGDGVQLARRTISYDHQHDSSASKDAYSLNATKGSIAEAQDQQMNSRSLGIKGDRKTTSIDGQDKKSGSEQDSELSYGKRENDEYMMLMEAREEYSSDLEEMDGDLLGNKEMMTTRSNHASNSGSGNNKNGRITIANAGNGGDARSGNGGDASGHSYDPVSSDFDHSNHSSHKSSNSKKPSSTKKSGGNSNNGINLNVLDHLFNDNYFDQKCSEKGFTKNKPKVTAKTSSHSTGGNNYGGTGSGNGGSANSGNATGGNGGNAVITEN